jgi:DNA primase
MSRFSRSFLDEVLNRVSILDVVGRKVSWDKRKSQPARGDMWACCPFHNEKSPSFHAVESKGFYKCFGCGEQGNAFDFVMATENVPFHEAVERLASSAGLALPAPDPQAEQKAETSDRLRAALDAARAAYEQALRSSDGAKARTYLQKRGIAEVDWLRFGLGYAPNGRTWLKDRLTQGGHRLDDLLEAGLLRTPDDGGPPYDLYRGRLMFAIEDGRGRTISFGARTLDPDGMPKYINGPESPVFNKGRNLYRYANARTAARDKPIVVAEGYIDVIALERAGFAAVAPLGTALTEDQLALLWKATPRPILCFDGDSAGIKAAERALDRALPLISAEKTLAFAFLPEGQDPDDVLRARGSAAIESALNTALNVATFLFQREAEREPLNSAEAKAGLRKRLRALTSQVQDPELQRELLEDVRAQADALLKPARQTPFVPRGRPGFGQDPLLGPVTNELRLKIKGATTRPTRSLIDIVIAPLMSPELLEGHDEAFAGLDIDDSGLDSLRHALLDLHQSGVSIDFEAVRRHLAQHGNETGVRALDEARRSPVNPFAKVGLVPEMARRAWVGAIERHEARRALAHDAVEAISAASGGDDAAFETLKRLVAERRALKTDQAPD